MKTEKPIKTFRVFVTRYYIAVDWYDIKETTPGRARAKAVRTARKLRKDARAEATDNGWIPDPEVIEVPKPGHCEGGKHPMDEVAPGVFRFKETS